MTSHYEKIAKRLRESRTNLGLTIKQLSERTPDFSPARISHWENAAREPSIDTLKVLAKALGVAPTYLMGMTDDPNDNAIVRVPLLPLQSIEVQIKKTKGKKTNQSKSDTLLLDNERDKLSCNAFATTVKDNSMSPHLLENDIVIADPEQLPMPGNLVIAHLNQTDKNLIRKYREGNTPKTFELVATHPDWATITPVNKSSDGSIIATVMSVRRHTI